MFKLLLIFSSLMVLFHGFQPPVQAGEPASRMNGIPWHDLKTYDSLPAALAVIGSTQATILISDLQPLKASLTIPANITLHFLQGGGLIMTRGIIITINGHLEAGPYQIFYPEEAGTVVFSAGSIGQAPVEWWGALGDDRADNVKAFAAAIASVNETYGNPTLILGPGHYRLGGPVLINKNNLTLKGVGHRITKLKCQAAGAGLVLDKGGRKVIYATRLEEFEVDGNGLARLGIDMVNTSETTFRSVSVRNCLTGIRIGGTVNPSQGTFTEGVVADCGTGVKFINATNPIFDKGNFWNNTIVFDFDTAYAPVFTNNWIEKFTTVFLFSHLKSKGQGVSVPTVVIRNNYLLSTDGGQNNECRIIRFLGDNGSHHSQVGPVIFEGNHLHLLSAKYLVEIGWGSLWGAGNRVRLSLKDNHLYEGRNTRAWFKTDVHSEIARSHAHLIFQDNLYPPQVTIQEGFGGLVTGVGAMDSDWGTASRVLGALVYAPLLTFPVNSQTPSIKSGNVFRTANTGPTKISTFRDGLAGQKIMVIFGDSKTTVGFKKSELKGNNGMDWRPSEGDWMECLFDGTRWYCLVQKSGP